MVYCVKCGAKNPDDAKTCSQCGAPLYSLTEGKRSRHRDDECFGTRVGVEPRERVEEECFGIPKGGAVVGLAIGIIIVLAGLSLLFQELLGISLPWWPFVIILFGVLVIMGAVYGLRRRY
ncbi:MAG: zinc-ribbon domain-containing protein [Candidatus Bathyarchaeales archaeon]|nr:MAG: zinc ribbon domain-containing protein [Candidatus Bathyarchaeota archaeon]